MKNFRPVYDKINSSFGWKIQLLPEYDSRKVKEGPCIFDGYSKLLNQAECENKNHLLMKHIDMLFTCKWIDKSSKIAMYKSDGYFRYPIQSNLLILRFDWINGMLKFMGDKEHINPMVERFVCKLVDTANVGKNEILKVVI